MPSWAGKSCSGGACVEGTSRLHRGPHPTLAEVDTRGGGCYAPKGGEARPLVQPGIGHLLGVHLPQVSPRPSPGRTHCCPSGRYFLVLGNSGTHRPTVPKAGPPCLGDPPPASPLSSPTLLPPVGLPGSLNLPLYPDPMLPLPTARIFCGSPVPGR